MARSRNIKPGFFKNEDLAECSPFARLCFAGMWLLADREGRLEDRPKRIKGELFAFDTVDVEPLLQELVRWGFITRYQVAGGRYINIVKFKENQTLHGLEKDSVIPDENGFLTVHERGKNGCATGKFALVHHQKTVINDRASHDDNRSTTVFESGCSPPENCSITVYEPLDNRSTTVFEADIRGGENALNSSLLNSEFGSPPPDGGGSAQPLRDCSPPPACAGQPTPGMPAKQRSLPVPGVPDSLLADWLAVRKAKRAGPVTQAVIDGLEREAAKAAMSVADAVRMCCEAGWQGFNAEWAKNRAHAASGPPGGENPRPQWAIDAGFKNRWEAENAGCFERTAHRFRAGKRRAEALA